jgi:hypothetical protein
MKLAFRMPDKKRKTSFFFMEYVSYVHVPILKYVIRIHILI